MAEVDSQIQQDEGAQPKSDFKIYLEQHPELTQELFKVCVNLFQDPSKESQVAE